MSRKKDQSIIAKAYAEHIKYLHLCKQIEDKLESNSLNNIVQRKLNDKTLVFKIVDKLKIDE